MNRLRFIPTGLNKRKSIGLTLAELLVATSLLILILSTVSVLDIASRKFFSKAEKGSAALQDVSLAMEYIQKSGQQAIGDISSGHPAYENDATGTTFCAGYTKGCRFIIDYNQNGIWDDMASVDPYDTFCYDATGHTLTLLESSEIIAKRMVDFIGDNTTEPGVIFFHLASRDNPNVAASADNPDVYLEAKVYPRASSVK